MQTSRSVLPFVLCFSNKSKVAIYWPTLATLYLMMRHTIQDFSTADQFANALRGPLAAIGVQVIRHHRPRSNSSVPGFQAHGWTRSEYCVKLKEVDQVIHSIMKRLTKSG